MNKKIPLLTLGAALIAVPVLAAPGGDRNATQTRAEVQTRAAEMFARMDVNQDGKLDTADRAAKRAERGEKRAAADEAGQGKRHAMRGHHGKRGGHHAMRMMGKADTDGDKAISQAEFQTAALGAPCAARLRPLPPANKPFGRGFFGNDRPSPLPAVPLPPVPASYRPPFPTDRWAN